MPSIQTSMGKKVMNYKKINNCSISDVFVATDELAYRDGKIFYIYKSSSSHCLDGLCIGRVKIIVDNDGNILETISHLRSSQHYKILDSKKVDLYKRVLAAIDSHNKFGCNNSYQKIITSTGK